MNIRDLENLKINHLEGEKNLDFEDIASYTAMGIGNALKGHNGFIMALLHLDRNDVVSKWMVKPTKEDMAAALRKEADKLESGESDLFKP